jgi:hypothetical protein
MLVGCLDLLDPASPQEGGHFAGIHLGTRGHVTAKFGAVHDLNALRIVTHWL